MYGANNQGIQLGLYHFHNADSPTYIIGLDNKEQCMDTKSADSLWKLLRSAIQQIQRKHHSNLNFEELYRYGYYLVMHKHGSVLYSGLQDVISQHLRSKVQCKVLANLNSNFLQVINSSWDHHLTCMTMIRDILMYMDRVYIKQNGLDDIYTLGLNLFKNQVVFFESIQNFLQSTLLEMVEKERNGELVDRNAFRCATRMLMVLGNHSPTVYQEIFEGPFLQQTANFCRTESQQLLKEKNASLYLKRVDSHVSDEIERSKQCFDELTLPKITKVVNDELIRAHMKTVAEMNGSGIVYMIEQQSTDDLSCMYKLYARVPDGLKTMFNIISHYLRQQGQILIRDEETNNNALIYVQNLLDLKDKIDFFLINSFSNDRLCKQMIAADFEHILNLNSKSPEYLSLFIDDKLKKTVKVMTDSDKAILLDKTMVLFRFLQDKDLFEQYYNKHLAKRLLLSKVINEENEKDVIVKFKAECGLQYTRKMEGMFRDMWMSTSVTNAFQKHIRDSDEEVHGVDLSVQVLTAVYWPTQQNLLPCNVPLVPLTAFSTFKKFYLALHCGRKLTLLPHLGTAELEMYFVRPHCEGEDGEGWQADITACGEIRSYTLQVSTYQMCILMLFNNRPQWNYQELQEETNICHKDLVRALQILIVGKPSQRVLIKRPNSRKIDHGDFFHVNKTFASKTNRVKLPTYLIKYESESERQDTMKRINEDRNYEIEAAIIRIMKSRRVMHHENLMYELITMLTPRFVPTRENIKTRIEVLIEREYIARNSEDRLMYTPDGQYATQNYTGSVNCKCSSR